MYVLQYTHPTNEEHDWRKMLVALKEKHTLPAHSMVHTKQDIYI